MKLNPIIKYQNCPVCGRVLEFFVELNSNQLQRICRHFDFNDPGEMPHQYKENLFSFRGDEQIFLQTIEISISNQNSEELDFCQIEYSYEFDISTPKMVIISNDYRIYNFHYKFSQFTSSIDLLNRLDKLRVIK